jgi:dephospho-CoA kinase
VLAADGSIDRKVLGPRVFKDPLEMQRLNVIVWPEIKRKAAEQVRAIPAGEVVVMEAAVLMEAGWSEDDSLVDEVWVTFVDKKEAIQRVVQRNHVSEDEAERRVSRQMANEERISKADVLLTTLFAKEVTQAMCKEAWEALQDRVTDRQRSLSGRGIRERWEWVVRRMYRRKPKKPVKARVNLTEDDPAETKESKEDVDDEEDSPEWTPVKARGPRRRGVKTEAMEDDGDAATDVVVKKEEGDGAQSMEVDAGNEEVVELPPASELDAVLVRWWSVLPHSEAIDELRTSLFRTFDQQRPQLLYPEEVSARAPID